MTGVGLRSGSDDALGGDFELYAKCGGNMTLAFMKSERSGFDAIPRVM